MMVVPWRSAASDGLAWVADPEALYHLVAWLDAAGGGWDWFVLHGPSGSYPRKVGQSFGRLERGDDAARRAAEAAYQDHRARGEFTGPAPRR